MNIFKGICLCTEILLDQTPEHSSCVVSYVFLTLFLGKMSFTAEQKTVIICLFN